MDTSEKKYGAVAGAATEKDSSAAAKTVSNTESDQQSGVVQNTMQTLKQAQTAAPTFSGEYDREIANIYDQIVNRPKFSYDYSTDPAYGQYRELYTRQGQQAMKDTQGQAAALTGGYGSTYSQAVGQQAYDDYITRLNEMMPALRQQALTEYENEGDRLARQYSMATARGDTAYGRYRDQIGDQQYADTLARQEATDRAALGDWSAYRDLYGEAGAKIAAIMQNPQAAYAQGIATGEEIYAYTGAYPKGYTPKGAGRGDPWAYGGSGWNPTNGGGGDVNWKSVFTDQTSKGNAVAAKDALEYAIEDGQAFINENGDFEWKK